MTKGTRFPLAIGLRASDITRLRWEQVHMARSVAWYEGVQMMNGRPLNVPLNADAMKVLHEQTGLHPIWVFPLSRRTRDSKGDAAQVWGEPTKKISNHAWRKACDRAGWSWLRFHDLRQTWASWQVQRGTPLPALQELGAWSRCDPVPR